MAEQIGGGSLRFAPQVKGLEIPGYEPRALQTMGLGFAVGARGADHNRSSAYEIDFSTRVDRRSLTPDAAALAVETEDRAALMDSLILCKFLQGVLTHFFADAATMLNLITGWPVTADDLRQTARRIVTAKKLFNIRAGWTPDEDTLPERFLADALPDDTTAHLSRERLSQAIKTYNQTRGWTPDGWVDDSRLAQLGLHEFADRAPSAEPPE
jgi:aldehyde:ferredoxin oxidoreductase